MGERGRGGEEGEAPTINQAPTMHGDTWEGLNLRESPTLKHVTSLEANMGGIISTSSLLLLIIHNAKIQKSSQLGPGEGEASIISISLSKSSEHLQS